MRAKVRDKIAFIETAIGSHRQHCAVLADNRRLYASRDGRVPDVSADGNDHIAFTKLAPSILPKLRLRDRQTSVEVNRPSVPVLKPDELVRRRLKIWPTNSICDLSGWINDLVESGKLVSARKAFVEFDCFGSVEVAVQTRC